jgi:hypothetical protein
MGIRVWLLPRRLLVKDLAAVVEECKELREASVRRAKDSEALRAELRRERGRSVALEEELKRYSDVPTALAAMVEGVGWAHSDDAWFVLSTGPAPCDECRPVYLGPPKWVSEAEVDCG